MVYFVWDGKACVSFCNNMTAFLSTANCVNCTTTALPPPPPPPWDTPSTTTTMLCPHHHHHHMGCMQSSTIHATKAFYGAFKIWGFWVPSVKRK